MFSSICPECGLEIPPQAKECVACNPLAASVDLMELEPRAPKPKAYVAKPEPLLLAAANDEAPKALMPPRKSEVPAPRAPRVPMPLALTGRTWNPAAKIAEAEAAVVATKLPPPISTVAKGPALAARQDYSSLAFSKLSPKAPSSKPKGGSPEAQLSMPGPALPYELTSLNAAGIAKMLVSVGPWMGGARPQSSNWFLSSLIAAGVAVTVLGGVFYAMPTLAGPTRAAAPPHAVTVEVPQPAKPVEPELPSDPLSKAIEVTGVRFVAGIPERRPELHYLVVNHSNVALAGVVVSVTLRASTDSSPVAQFSFRTPRMNAFESKEMVSAVEKVNSANLPDWRRVHADIHIVQ